MECINLQQQFGTRYHITFDPAYDPRNRPKDKLDPWMMQISCQRGVIYPHGGSLLAVELDGHRITANRLRGLDCTTTYQDGDGYLAVTFDVSGFDEVACILKPKRRRQISPAERRRLATIGATTRFETRQSEPVIGPVRRSDVSA